MQPLKSNTCNCIFLVWHHHRRIPVIVMAKEKSHQSGNGTFCNIGVKKQTTVFWPAQYNMAKLMIIIKDVQWRVGTSNHVLMPPCHYVYHLLCKLSFRTFLLLVIFAFVWQLMLKLYKKHVGTILAVLCLHILHQCVIVSMLTLDSKLTKPAKMDYVQS